MNLQDLIFKAQKINSPECIFGQLQTTANCKRAWIKETSESDHTWIEIDVDTVCQFTGSEDVNDRPIYEHDKNEKGWICIYGKSIGAYYWLDPSTDEHHPFELGASYPLATGY